MLVGRRSYFSDMPTKTATRYTLPFDAVKVTRFQHYKDWSDCEFARKVGYHRNLVAKVMKGQQPASADFIATVSVVTGIPLHELIDGDPIKKGSIK